MAADTNYENKQKKLHISYEERAKWDKVVVDFDSHLGAGGVYNHALGNGEVPGFSMNDFSNEYKRKLDGIEENALHNPYPGSIPYSEVTGLSLVGHTGKYSDLDGIPESFWAGGGNSDTVGGITITVGGTQPSNPANFKNVWFDTTNKLVRVYYNNIWNSFCAVYA